MADEANAIGAARQRESAAIGAMLQSDFDAVTDEMVAELADGIELLGSDADLLDLMRASVGANIDQLIHAVRYGFDPATMSTPQAAIEYARRVAQRGIDVTALVRAYRLGQSMFLDECFQRVRSRSLPDALALDLIHDIVTMVSSYIDMASERVVNEYNWEQERWREHQGHVRASRIAELLDRGASAGAEEELDYPLAATHLAVILWVRQEDADDGPFAALADLTAAAETLAHEAPTCARFLLTPVDRATVWLWLPLRDPASLDAVALARRAGVLHERVAIAVGEPGTGIDGFRASHRQATIAREIAVLRRPLARRITAFAEPGLSTVALLRHNLDDTRRWVAEHLRALAAGTPAAAALRTTLLAYLQSGFSPKATAAVLTMHPNSVKYRIRRAEEALGRPVTDDVLPTALALLAAEWFGDAVLAPRGRESG